MTIEALRYRHATTEERQRGCGPMKGVRVTYDIDRDTALRRLRKGVEHGHVADSSLIALDARRPIPETDLRAAFTEEELAKALVDQEYDVILVEETLRKSALADGSAVEFEPLTMIVEEFVTKSERSPIAASPIRRSVTTILVPSVAEVRDRLLKGIAENHPAIKETDVASLDAGRGVREAALRAAFPDAEFVAADDVLFDPMTKCRLAAADLEDLIAKSEGDQ